jgi:hypothetical protein
MALTKATYSMIENAPVNVRDFGAVGDGITDDTAAIQAAVDYAYANGIDVVFPSDIPDYYKVTVNIVCRSGVSMKGIGGHAKIKNLNTTGSSTMNKAVFLMGNLATQIVQNLTFYSCGTISAGSVVTLSTPADASNFSVGTQVVTASTNFSVAAGTNVFDYMHLNEVVSIVGAVITLKYPIDISYVGGIAKLSELSTTGAPVVLPLYFIENCSFENLDIESTSYPFPSYTGTYNVTMRDCIIRGRTGIYGNCFQYSTFDNLTCYFSDVSGEFAENSLSTTLVNSKFIYTYDAAITPTGRFQISESSRNCQIKNNNFDVNALALSAGQSLFVFGGAQNCAVDGNIITSANIASEITVCTFFGRTLTPDTDFACINNTFDNNIVKMRGVRYFVAFNMVQAENTNNCAENNSFMAEASSVSDSVIFLDSTGNRYKNNSSNYSSISLDVGSSSNEIVGNFSPTGFGANATAVSNVFYQNNTLRNNQSTASKVKQKLAFNTNATITGAASATTNIIDVALGTSLAVRDVITLDTFCTPNGTSATKPVKLEIYNNTDAVSLVLFSHAVPALSTGVQFFSTKVFVKASTISAVTTIYDATLNTTTTIANEVVRPATDKDLSFILSTTLGAGLTMAFTQIVSSYSNPYN